MNLTHIGGTQRPVEMLQYMRLLRESAQDTDDLLCAAFQGRGVRTQIAFADLAHVSTMFVLRGVTWLTFDYLKDKWPGVFCIRPQPEKEEVQDVIWHVTWEDLFASCNDELTAAAVRSSSGEFSPHDGEFDGLDFKLANGAMTLLFKMYDDAQVIFEDYALFQGQALEARSRCMSCSRYVRKGRGVIGKCDFFEYLTGEERVCKRFKKEGKKSG